MTHKNQTTAELLGAASVFLIALFAVIVLLYYLAPLPGQTPPTDPQGDIPVPLGVSFNPPFTIGTHCYTATTPITISGVLTNVILLHEQQ